MAYYIVLLDICSNFVTYKVLASSPPRKFNQMDEISSLFSYSVTYSESDFGMVHLSGQPSEVALKFLQIV
jgi:hypothetical protein